MTRSRLLGVLAAIGAAGAFGLLALHRHEPVDAVWLLVAAACCYTLGYRFYARFLARTVLRLDPRRATPAVRHRDGKDYEPSNRWVVFGHHFAAIAGAGPLVGPVLAAQFGYLPGLLWLLVGAVLAGAVQDFVILVGSVRRDGRSLAQMVRDELGPWAGGLASAAILAIMAILLAVLALVVVKALADSPWGTFTIAMTIPIALAVGWYMRNFRPGAVLEASLLGFALLLAAVVGGQAVATSPVLAGIFTLNANTLAWVLIGYGFLASVLPVWLLLAPRDYLSTFVKIGAILMMALGVLITLPVLRLPMLTRYAFDGLGPVVAGNLFPFCFITLACGAVSGFHALISSGTTPKLLASEADAPLVGYGAMLMESFVGLSALIAAGILTPGVYFALNTAAAATGPTPEAATLAISGWGFPVGAAEMAGLARSVGEKSLLHRTGGAPTFALGMALLYGKVLGQNLLGVCYHFAIMFEALFILTTVDAGTRVGRFLVQDALGRLHPRLGHLGWAPAAWLASALVVAGWGFFLIQGVTDPLGGINALWPLFGIANQLLAAIALALGTTILLKTASKRRYALVCAVPFAALVALTFSAALAKLFSADPRIGFLAHRAAIAAKLAGADAASRPELRALMRNDLIDAAAGALLLLLAGGVVIAAIALWVRLLRGAGDVPPSSETPPMLLPA